MSSESRDIGISKGSYYSTEYEFCFYSQQATASRAPPSRVPSPKCNTEGRPVLQMYVSCMNYMNSCEINGASSKCEYYTDVLVTYGQCPAMGTKGNADSICKQLGSLYDIEAELGASHACKDVEDSGSMCHTQRSHR